MKDQKSYNFERLKYEFGGLTTTNASNTFLVSL
jgi:hypothetical protein